MNALIWRLYKKESIWSKWRSYCRECRQNIRAKDLIPVLSFVLLGGKCRYCRKKISWQYPLVELATASLFVLAALKHQLFQFDFLMYDYGTWFLIIRDWIFISILIVIFVYDYKYYLILDKVTIPAMVLALVLNLIIASSGFWLVWLVQLLLAGIIGGAFFYIQILLSKGRWVGGGDVRLGILMGFMLGISGLLLAFFIAYVVGAIFGLILVATKKKTMKSEIPFGTFLSAAAIFALLFSPYVINWYLALLR